MQILGGDFGENTPARIQTRLNGSPTELWVAKGLSRIEIPFFEIEAVTEITDENKVSVLGGLGWGVAGTLIAGPIGAVVGGLLGGRKKVVTVMVSTTKGKKLLATATPAEVTQLTTMAMRRKPRVASQVEPSHPKPKQTEISPEDQDVLGFLMDED